LRQDRDPGKQKLKGAVRTEPIGAIIASTVDMNTCHLQNDPLGIYYLHFIPGETEAERRSNMAKSF
jgi:hypothetical protein